MSGKKSVGLKALSQIVPGSVEAPSASTMTVAEANAVDAAAGLVDPKAEVPNLDVAPATPVANTNVPRSDEPKTGEEVDLDQYPTTQVAWDWLTAKAEGRPPFRYFVRKASLSTAAKAKTERSEKGEQLVLAEMKLLVGEGETLACKGPKCGKSFKEVWSVVIGKDPDANVEPLAMLPAGISALVMRHKDGAAKVSGAHIELVTRRDTHGHPVDYEFLSFCGSRYFLAKNDNGTFKTEWTSNSSCLGKAVKAASDKMPDRTDGTRPTAYTYDGTSVREIVERREFATAKSTALDRAKTAGGGQLSQPHGEGEFRGRGYERGQSSRESSYRGR